MTLLQILFAGGLVGLIGFGLYWFGVVLKAGPESTKTQVNKDPRLK